MKSRSRARLFGVVWAILLTLALGVVLIPDLLPSGNSLSAGDVSPTDIVAPARVTYESAIRRQRAREQAAARVEPVYTPPDRAQVFQQISRAEVIADYIEGVRSDVYSNAERKAELIEALEDVHFSGEAAATILSLSAPAWRGVVSETLRILDVTMRREIREEQLPEIRRGIASQVGVGLSEEQAQVVEEWVRALVVPNTFVDAERTARAREAALADVAPVEQTYERGQIILRRGEVVTSEHLEALELLGLQRVRPAGRQILGAFLYAVLLVLAFGVYLARLHPDVWTNQRSMAALFVLLVGLAAAGKLLISMGGMLPYLVPTAAGAMLVAVLLNVQLAAALTVMLALVLGFMGDSLELAAYTVIGGVIAALSLHRVDRLGTFVWSTGLVALANVGVVMSFGLLSGFYLPLEQLRIAGAAVVNGFLCASLAIAALYFVSNWLGVTTFLQLVELGRPTSPLFKELLVKAPGTYHHSIMVSNLAERAAEEIGADPLLVRIGAYYHDVGKTRKPEFFVENQANGHNPHDDLDDPWESARLIIAHVAEGVKLARKHNLPPQIVDFIRQHHGTTVVGYFYHKAVERVGSDQVRIEDFRYPGPRPQSREGGILLLADAVEAAARAERPDGPVAIEALVRKLAAKRFADGQFDECDLTLRDLERICSAFVEVLQGIYHPRVRYPQEVSAHPQASEVSEDLGSVAQPLAAGAVASALPASPAAVESGGDGGQTATEGVNEGAAARGSPGGGLRQELGSLPVEGMVISAEQRSASDRPALGAAG